MQRFTCPKCFGQNVDEIIYGSKVAYKCYKCGNLSNRALAMDSRLKLDLGANGQLVHSSVSLLVKNAEGKILLIRRRYYPVTWAIISGHMHIGEAIIEAAKRELVEETGSMADNLKFLFKTAADSRCRTGVIKHKLHVFEYNLPKNTEIVPNSEAQNIAWVSPSNLAAKAYKPMTQNTVAVLKKIGYL